MDRIKVTDKTLDSAINNAVESLHLLKEQISYTVVGCSKDTITIEAWRKLEQSKLRKCPDCDKEISRKAESCPHCGCPIEKTITCAYCGYDTDLTYKQIQDGGFCVTCKNCGKEVRVSSPADEARWELQRQKEAKAECPYCHSTNTVKITTTAKVVNTALFGLLGNKRKHQWHCNNCKSDF